MKIKDSKGKSDGGFVEIDLFIDILLKKYASQFNKTVSSFKDIFTSIDVKMSVIKNSWNFQDM